MQPRHFAFQVLKQHHKAISDLDWSLENTFLLSAGLDGSVSMWLSATGQLLRVFLTASAALCARFHLVNQNLVMAGTESGIVQVFNCSTGKSSAGPTPHEAISASCCLLTDPVHSFSLCSVVYYYLYVAQVVHWCLVST